MLTTEHERHAAGHVCDGDTAASANVVIARAATDRVHHGDIEQRRQLDHDRDQWPDGEHHRSEPFTMSSIVSRLDQVRERCAQLFGENARDVAEHGKIGANSPMASEIASTAAARPGAAASNPAEMPATSSVSGSRSTQ